MVQVGLAAAIGTALILAACAKAPAPVASAPDVVAVKLAAVAASDAGSSLAMAGTVRLKRETALAFNTAGRLARVDVREGDTVRAGQPLARLDPTGLDAAAAAARADAVRADADYKRLRALGAAGWVTRPRVESAQAATAAAAARVNQTGFDVRFSRIVAPTAGVVLRRHLEPGQMVATGTPVVTIGELASGYVLRVPLPDGDLARLRLGDHAAVTIAAVSPVAIPAVVSEIAARGDDRTGTFQVELRLPPVAGLRSGLIGNAVLRVAAGPAVSTTTQRVPASAVFAARADEGFVYVYVPATGTVRTRLVRLGDVDDRSITVTWGLRAGEQVVVSGVDRLRDGAKVRVAT